jgi:release factor glutamine methyltransferase
VLIPRFDTETLIQWAVDCAPENGKVLDVCTGSGCVALAIKAHRPDLTLFACDISPKAIDVAKENGSRLRLAVQWAQGDLLEPYDDMCFDVIVANPPYISGREYEILPKRVRDYEPKLALYGGEDGLAMYRRLIKESAGYLKDSGALAVEIGYDQAKKVRSLFEIQGFCDIKTIEDMEHRPRVIAGEWGDPK